MKVMAHSGGNSGAVQVCHPGLGRPEPVTAPDEFGKRLGIASLIPELTRQRPSRPAREGPGRGPGGAREGCDPFGGSGTSVPRCSSRAGPGLGAPRAGRTPGWAHLGPGAPRARRTAARRTVGSPPQPRPGSARLSDRPRARQSGHRSGPRYPGNRQTSGANRSPGRTQQQRWPIAVVREPPRWHIGAETATVKCHRRYYDGRVAAMRGGYSPSSWPDARFGARGRTGRAG